jgi:hypothetical protein
MNTDDKLFILWTSGDPDTFHEMVFMYAFNAIKYGWWKAVTVVIWGASAKLAGHERPVQLELLEMIAGGVQVEACKACADDLGVSERLTALGIEVRYWGEALTEVIKSDAKLITV